MAEVAGHDEGGEDGWQPRNTLLTSTVVVVVVPGQCVATGAGCWLTANRLLAHVSLRCALSVSLFPVQTGGRRAEQST